MAPTEKEIAVMFANRLLEEPYADRDDAVRILARQFLRSVETLCSVCGEPTNLCCADCRIDLKTNVYVCEKKTCRDLHNLKCPYEILLRSETK